MKFGKNFNLVSFSTLFVIKSHDEFNGNYSHYLGNNVPSSCFSCWPKNTHFLQAVLRRLDSIYASVICGYKICCNITPTEVTQPTTTFDQILWLETKISIVHIKDHNAEKNKCSQSRRDELAEEMGVVLKEIVLGNAQQNQNW